MSALHFFSNTHGFTPIIFDQQISRVNPKGRTEDLKKISQRLTAPLEYELLPHSTLRIILRLLLRLNRRWGFISTLDEPSIEKLTQYTIPRLFFIQDYFQHKKYPLSIPLPTIRHAFQPLLESASEVQNTYLNSPNCLIHLRLTDSHTRSDIVFQKDDFIFLMHKLLSNFPSIKFNLISDDATESEAFLNLDKYEFEFQNLERNQRLTALQLLALFSKHDIVICSLSTICWWGCFLSTKLNFVDSQIFSSFPEELHLNEWDRFKTRP